MAITEQKRRRAASLAILERFLIRVKRRADRLFSWPGLGLMTMSAIMSRDYPVIMGVCLLSAVVVLAGNLITDILYAVVNPTIQYQ